MSEPRRRRALEFAGFPPDAVARFLDGDIGAGSDAEVERLAAALDSIERAALAKTRKTAPPAPPPRRPGRYVPFYDRKPRGPHSDLIDGPPQPIMLCLPDTAVETQAVVQDLLRHAAAQRLDLHTLTGRVGVDPLLLEAVTATTDPRPAARLPVGDVMALAGALGQRLAVVPWPLAARTDAGRERCVIVDTRDPAYEAGVDEAEARREAAGNTDESDEPIPF